MRISKLRLASFAPVLLALAACSSSSSSTTPPADGGKTPVDSGKTMTDAAKVTDAAKGTDAVASDATGGPTTTIAAAVMGKVTTPITVKAVVTALHGDPSKSPEDVSQWYIEDPAGGKYSGIAVYCDPDKPACPTIRAPLTPNALVEITGTIETYMGLAQFIPTAQTILMATTTPPPVATITAADALPTASSPYRGVVVKLVDALTVDSVTPIALHDSQCTTVVTTDGGAVDGGQGQCTGCTPPTYSGFEAKDATGNSLYVEEFFFYFDHYQSSPECLTLAGAKPVTVGQTFSSLVAVLDWDSYASAQALYPLSDADVVTP
jgi:predicted extracellular nuclease